MALRVLAACPGPAALEAFELAAAGAGCEVFCAASARAARELAAGLAPDVILWERSGDLDDGALAAVLRHVPSAYVVALAPAADAARAPAAPSPLCHDLLALPFGQGALRLVLQRAAWWRQLHRDVRLLRREIAQGAGDRPIVAASPAMIELLESLERAAGFGACVLLRGEHGTGREGLARALHAQSDRRQGPFVALSCVGTDAPSVSAALLGRSSAAGPIESGCLRDAHGGTLFLDQVDALPADSQAALLHYLETGEVARVGGDKPRRTDARVIAATTRDPRASVSAGLLAPALAERIAAIELVVPPLRERQADIPLLVDHFVARASRWLGRPPPVVTDDALERLVAYPWPGNVRELESVVGRSVQLARGDRISTRQLPELLAAGDESRDGELGLRRARKRLEVDLIRQALRRTGGNRTHAARLLEISHRALLYKLKEHGVGE